MHCLSEGIQVFYTKMYFKEFKRVVLFIEYLKVNTIHQEVIEGSFKYKHVFCLIIYLIIEIFVYIAVFNYYIASEKFCNLTKCIDTGFLSIGGSRGRAWRTPP